MQSVSIHIERLQEKANTLFVGLPDAGLVGLIAANQIVHDMKLQGMGWIDLGDYMPPTAVVHSGLPFSPVQFFAGSGIAIITAEVPIPVEASKVVGESVLSVAKKISAKEIVTIGGLASEDRYEEEAQPSVYFVSSSPEAVKKMSDVGIYPLDGGLLMGVYAQLMIGGIREEIPVNAFYANAYPRLPDPGAAAVLLTALSKIYPIKVDVDSLIKQSEEIRMKTKQIMQQVASTGRPSGSFMYT
ncbi:MAG TPA: proteasome assembly chaperone family protein [Thermoprotei archaeon]|nr:PAC2 family protein [TACK group archaeon]HEV51781.1 proteasome assembly chaperone family protein [Thermoprotei archaeon]